MNASSLKFLFIVAAALGLSACGGAGLPAPPAPDAPHRLASLERAHGSPAASSCLTAVCLYVANNASTRHDADSYVTVYAAGANGNVAPVQTVRGSKTGLSFPQGIALDAGGKIYVTNNTRAPRVVVYAAGANGNVAPLSTIVGPRTGLIFPVGVALDTGGNIYVADLESESFASGGVTVYAAGANGNVAPLRTIKGGRTALTFPFGVALDASRNIYVANGGQFGGITVFAAGAHGDVKPLRLISGAKTQLNNALGIALDAGGKIYVANGNGNRVNVYAADANGNVAPIRVIGGPQTKLRFPFGIALDAAGNIYVADSPSGAPGAQSFVRVYAAGASGDVAPIRSIGGRNTELETPFGIAVH
jgi:sugar lactone lactonase YvrE